MSDGFIDERPPVTFWIVGGAALLWNLFGLMMYIMTVTGTPEGHAAKGYTPEQVDFIMSMSPWATSAFAIAVNAGVLASLFLLFRKSWAIPMFALSLAFVLILNGYNFVIRDTFGLFGMSEVYIQSTVVIFGILFLVYARYAKRKGWLT